MTAPYLPCSDCGTSKGPLISGRCEGCDGVFRSDIRFAKRLALAVFVGGPLLIALVVAAVRVWGPR